MFLGKPRIPSQTTVMRKFVVQAKFLLLPFHRAVFILVIPIVVCKSPAWDTSDFVIIAIEHWEENWHKCRKKLLVLLSEAGAHLDPLLGTGQTAGQLWYLANLYQLLSWASSPKGLQTSITMRREPAQICVWWPEVGQEEKKRQVEKIKGISRKWRKASNLENKWKKDYSEAPEWETRPSKRAIFSVPQ